LFLFGKDNYFFPFALQSNFYYICSIFMYRPTFLVTNDDSINAPGIKLLIEAVRHLGRVVVVSPALPQSGMGHAITLNNPLRLIPSDKFGAEIEAYQCSGTPVDCVKLGIFKALNNQRPDIILSGVNHGSNVSTNILYSGTMSAAVEGALQGIPAVGFSFTDHSWQTDMSVCVPYIQKIVKMILEKGLFPHTCLNVNIPNLPSDEIKGIKLCRQARAFWEEDFQERKDPMGFLYYWLSGDFLNHDQGENSDYALLKEGYVTLVPVQFDMTCYQALSQMKRWNLDEA
jgi:5'-nucleotidase